MPTDYLAPLQPCSPEARLSVDAPDPHIAEIQAKIDAGTVTRTSTSVETLPTKRCSMPAVRL